MPYEQLFCCTSVLIDMLSLYVMFVMVLNLRSCVKTAMC